MTVVAPAPAGTSRQAVALIAARLATAVLGWVGTILVARSLEREVFGQFVFVFALLGLLTIVTDLGVGRVALKGLLPDALDRVAFGSAYVGLRVVLGVFGHLLAIGYVLATSQPPVVVAATVVGGIVVDLATPGAAMLTLFQAEGRLARAGALRVAGQLTQLSLVVVAVLAGGGLLWFVIPAVAGEAMVTVLVFRMGRRIQPIGLRVDVALWRSMLREAIPLSVAHALTIGLARVDTLLLSSMVGMSVVGSYGIAYKFIDLAHFVPVAIETAVLASLVTTIGRDDGAFAQSVAAAGRQLALAGGLMVVGIVATAPGMIGSFYGPGFEDAADPLTILAVGELAAFLGAIAVTAMIAAGRNRVFAAIMAAVFCVNIGLNVTLIPAFEQVGAAWATVAAEVLALGLVLVASRTLPGVSSAVLRATGGIVPGLAAGLAIAVVARGSWPWGLAGLVACSTYLAGCAATGAIPQGWLGVRRGAGNGR